MAYFSGLIEGLAGSFGEQRLERWRQQARREQLEQDFFRTLLTSDNPEIKSMALTGLASGAAGRPLKKGFGGFLGEVEANPMYGTLLTFLDTPQAREEQIRGLPSRTPTPESQLVTPPSIGEPPSGTPAIEGAAAQPETALVTGEAQPPPKPTALPPPGAEPRLSFGARQPGPIVGQRTVYEKPQVWLSPDERLYRNRMSTERADVDAIFESLRASGLYSEPEMAEIVKRHLSGKYGASAGRRQLGRPYLNAAGEWVQPVIDLDTGQPIAEIPSSPTGGQSRTKRVYGEQYPGQLDVQGQPLVEGRPYDLDPVTNKFYPVAALGHEKGHWSVQTLADGTKQNVWIPPPSLTGPSEPPQTGALPGAALGLPPPPMPDGRTGAPTAAPPAQAPPTPRTSAAMGQPTPIGAPFGPARRKLVGSRTPDGRMMAALETSDGRLINPVDQSPMPAGTIRVSDETIFGPQQAQAGRMADNILSQLDRMTVLVDKVFPAGSGFTGRVEAEGSLSMQSLQSTKDYRELEQLIESSLVPAAKAGGEVGVLTDQDVERVRTLFPKLGEGFWKLPDSRESAQWAIVSARRLIKRRKAAFIGLPYQPEPGEDTRRPPTTDEMFRMFGTDPAAYTPGRQGSTDDGRFFEIVAVKSQTDKPNEPLVEIRQVSH